MVAFSFRRRFVEPIRLGAKRQTVRALRADGRTAKAGDELQLYHAMRTRQCELIGRSPCVAVYGVQVWLGRNYKVEIDVAGIVVRKPDPDEFAVLDGFADWRDLEAFWAQEHPHTLHLAGTLTTWGDLL